MKFPQEVITWKVLPAIRAKLATRLKEEGRAQNEIAEILGLTAPAVSQYMSGKRAADFQISDEYKKYIDVTLEFLNKSKSDKAMIIIQKLCEKIEKSDEFKALLNE